MGILNAFGRKVPEHGMEEQHATLMPKWAQLGQTTGSRELPSEGQSLMMHTGQIRATYQRMLARYASGAAGSENVADLERSATEQKRKSLEQKQKDFSQEKARLQRDLENLPESEDAGGSQLGLMATTLLLCIGEAVITADALSVFSNNSQAREMLFMVSLVIVFAVLPHGLLGVYRYAKDKSYSGAVTAALAVFVVASFVGMGIMRSAALQNGGQATVEESVNVVVKLHWIWIVLLQVFLLFSSVYVASLMRTRAQKAKLYNRRSLETKLARTEERLEQVERELLSLPERTLRAASDREHSARETSAAQARIRAMYLEGLAAYMEANLSYRTTPAPSCFSEPILKL